MTWRALSISLYKEDAARCTPCLAGYSSAAGSGSCEACPVGTFSSAEVWRCRLIVSKPELKACLVSALETTL